MAASCGHKVELDGTPIFESPGISHAWEVQGSTVVTPCQSPYVSSETGQEEFKGENGRIHELTD